MNKNYRSSLTTALMFITVWDVMKYAWKKWYVDRNDFYTTDKEVIDKITKHLYTDDKLSILRDRMNNKIPSKIDLNNYDGTVFCKSRVIDPYFIREWKKIRVSDVHEKSKIMILNNKVKEYFIKFER
jgi:hypothetical protein